MILGLLALGAALFLAIQFIIIPRNEEAHEKYLAAQQDPAAHDLGAILKYKNRYMGNASNDINLFHSLPLSNAGMTFRLYPDLLKLEIRYPDTVESLGEAKVQAALLYNSTAAFALIGNLQTMEYSFPEASYEADRAEIEKLYADFGNILEKENWRTSVQEKMGDYQFVEASFMRVMEKSLTKHDE